MQQDQKLHLKVRYFQDSTPTEVPCREENFIRRELDFLLPVQQTALVLVDLWKVHHIDSWLERADRVVRESIVPVIEAARQAGITVVHAPCPKVARKYNTYEGRSPEPVPQEPTWPPAEFRRREGAADVFRGPRHQQPGVFVRWQRLEPLQDMHPDIRVHDGDVVIATGQQLHDLCEEHRLLHLIYAGFATNWCVLRRDYGIYAMRRRGYNTILLRDATEGIEFPDTLQHRWATELAIREVEQVHGFSASNEDFFNACRSA